MLKKLKIARIVTKCKDEFKKASNPCIITQRREEKRREEKRRFLRNYSFQNVLIYMCKLFVLNEKYKNKERNYYVIRS